MSSLAITFLLGCLVSLAIIPPLRRLCLRWGLVDQPDGRRKLHQNAVALCGGIACFLSTILVVAGLALVSERAQVALGHGAEFGGLLAAAVVLLATGVLDDAVGLRGRQKIIGQLAACVIVVASGLVIRNVAVFGYVIELGLLAVPITVLWIMAAINAVNLLDGINGLAGTVGIISAASIAVMAQHGGWHPAEAIIAAAIAGSLLGFLRYNFPRASVFLGDAGSMLIGLVIGVLSIQASLKTQGTVLLAAPVCLMALPLFDSAAAIIRRKLTGRSVFSTDRSHLHHRLTEKFGSMGAVLVVAIGCGLLALAALASVITTNERVAIVCTAAILLFFIATRIFGHSELRLLATRIHSVGTSLVTIGRKPGGSGRHATVRLQGNREWGLLWTSLKEMAEDLPVRRIELDVNAPALHEGFHAQWQRHGTVADERLWRFDIPLFSAGHSVGHMRITAERSSSSMSDEFAKMLEMFEEFEQHLRTFLADLSQEATAVAESGAATPSAPHFTTPVANPGLELTGSRS